MNGLALFALIIGLLIVCFIPLRPNTDARRRRARGPINLTLHRTDRR